MNSMKELAINVSFIEMCPHNAQRLGEQSVLVNNFCPLEIPTAKMSVECLKLSCPLPGRTGGVSWEQV